MENRKTDCPCKKIKCEVHGNCEACREHHRTVETRYLPACDRIKKKRSKKEKEKEIEK